MSPKHQRTRLLPKQLRQLRHDSRLLLIRKKVQERAEEDDVNLAAPALEEVWRKDVARGKVGGEAAAVAEELVAEVKEARLGVDANDVLARCAVVDELADVLAEAAPEVEEGGAGADAGQDLGVDGLEVRGVVEETEQADAGIRETVFLCGAVLVVG